jgi:hypothetical protein
MTAIDPNRHFAAVQRNGRFRWDCVAKVVLPDDQKFCGLQARLSSKGVRDLIA